jgi:hypothetical protein
MIRTLLHSNNLKHYCCRFLGRKTCLLKMGAASFKILGQPEDVLDKAPEPVTILNKKLQQVFPDLIPYG